jgi:hypothetical protein
MKDPVGDVCVLLVGPYLSGLRGLRRPIWGVFLTPFCLAVETESGECYVTSCGTWPRCTGSHGLYMHMHRDVHRL